MKFFKFSTLSIFALFAFAIFMPLSSFAVSTPTGNTKANQPNTVATVNIEGARIISQNGNTFSIAFTLSNRQGLQTGVKYGVELVKDGTNYITDEKVYDDSVTLYENSSINKAITYTAPSDFNGNYTLYLASYNENGFPFGMTIIGKAKLTASQMGVSIINNTCYLEVKGEKGSPHYTLTQSIDINQNELLVLNCDVLNETGSTITITPAYETRFFNLYGKLSQQEGGDYTKITLIKNQKKTIALVLPKGTMPQFYDLKFNLTNNSVSSNAIQAHYIISGVSGTIQNLSLDKDYYNAGNIGQMSFMWSVSAGSFTRSALTSATVPNVFVYASITNSVGADCIIPIQQKLVSDVNPQTTIPFKVNINCVDPHVSLRLVDETGNKLDQKDFMFKSNIADMKKSSDVLPTIAIIIALLAIVTIGIYVKKKKNYNFNI